MVYTRFLGGLGRVKALIFKGFMWGLGFRV